MTEITELQKTLRKFSNERNWDRYPKPANLAKSISIEAAELLEHYQWEDYPNDIHDIAMEVADVFIYLLMLCDREGIDLVASTKEKITLNALKYPV
jgi:dCTP diphosphatase